MDGPPGTAARTRDFAEESRKRLRAGRRIPSVQVGGLLDDDGCAVRQAFPRVHPEAVDVIRGTGGIRKIRWAMPGRGKRGGNRIMVGEGGPPLPAPRLSHYQRRT